MTNFNLINPLDKMYQGLKTDNQSVRLEIAESKGSDAYEKTFLFAKDEFLSVEQSFKSANSNEIGLKFIADNSSAALSGILNNITGLNDTLATFDKIIDMNATKMATLDQGLAQKDTEIDSLYSSLETYNTQMKTQEQTVASAMTSITNLNSKMSELDNSCASLSKDIDSIDDQLIKIKITKNADGSVQVETVRQLEAKRSAIINQIGEANMQRLQLEKQAQAENLKLEEIQAKITSTQEQIKNYESNLNKANTEKNVLVSEKDKIKAKMLEDLDVKTFIEAELNTLAKDKVQAENQDQADMLKYENANAESNEVSKMKEFKQSELLKAEEEYETALELSKKDKSKGNNFIG